jgi:hypothetical protein
MEHTVATQDMKVPNVLVVGCTATQLASWVGCAARAGVALRGVDLAGVTMVAQAWRPAAIVLTWDVYDFDPERFDALARSIEARLIKLPTDDLDPSTFEVALRTTLDNRLARTRIVTSGVRRRSRFDQPSEGEAEAAAFHGRRTGTSMR